MTALNKHALRQTAEKATPGPWEMEHENIWFRDTEGYTKHLMYAYQGDDVDDQQDHDNTAYIAAFNPKVVLALLDKLEAAEKRIAELEAREVKLPNPHAHLIWIQAGHAPDDYWDDVAVSHSEKDKCCDGSDRYPVYTLWEIKEALSAIGINVTAAGKGE